MATTLWVRRVDYTINDLGRLMMDLGFMIPTGPQDVQVVDLISWSYVSLCVLQSMFLMLL